ncbi:MAG: hypothetical protein ACYCTB_11705 [bacterium]
MIIFLPVIMIFIGTYIAFFVSYISYATLISIFFIMSGIIFAFPANPTVLYHMYKKKKISGREIFFWYTEIYLITAVLFLIFIAIPQFRVILLG